MELGGRIDCGWACQTRPVCGTRDAALGKHTLMLTLSKSLEASALTRVAEPFRSSPVLALASSLSSLHLFARHLHSTLSGSWTS